MYLSYEDISSHGIDTVRLRQQEGKAGFLPGVSQSGIAQGAQMLPWINLRD